MEIAVLGPGDAAVLENKAPEVFDHAIDPRWCAQFFADPRHHLAVAIDDGTVVGMVSAVHYVHPDKAPELWINEVGVASTHRRMGVAKRLLDAMLAHGRALGCGEAWVLTDAGNAAAMRLYAAAGGTEQVPQPVMFSFRLNRGEG
ncbi:GNAT family N-acetyltransferase [Longimicrobium sp.]|uniref:GNAT family N-acetyltransferase n=1 Tax=Longimicrobium sp. TaxID=2029185 RepID=UPI002BC018CE|nr:GNAT family N-acetyltransferase [Longimicrobium sp.]HSU14149.1 GNAT family N-acetyltransferase [Longimicrobium sp.]